MKRATTTRTTKRTQPSQKGTEESHLTAEETIPDAVQIFVKTLTGETIAVYDIMDKQQS